MTHSNDSECAASEDTGIETNISTGLTASSCRRSEFEMSPAGFDAPDTDLAPKVSTNALPRVKCRVCKKIRQQSAFSNRQLQEVRKRLAVAGGNGISGPGVAACRDCVGGQTVELTCIICDRTKSLESFSKVQRQNPDNAVGSPLPAGFIGYL